ncbi:MAG: amylo-alpha-1,6-glucosidase, partial [Melioribacteraceae bacterium]
LDAMKYLNLLGFESERPTIKNVDAADDGYGRRLGLHAYRSHPIFDGLNGGAYIFNPTKDQRTRQIGFFENSIPKNGKVIAVDWAYITLKENAKLIIEHEIGKGKILSIGAYTYYGLENNNRAHLELFTNNCLKYLAGSLKYEPTKTFYWNYSPATVYELKRKSDPVKFDSSRKWERNSNSIKLEKEKGTDNYWNVAGQKILVMGKEKSGIDEIWAHPFMALRDYEAGLLFDEKDSVVWLKNFQPKIEVRPESFSRIYKINNSTLREIIVASTKESQAVVHYEYEGVTSAKLVIKFYSNFRFMWPYSERTTGSIGYSVNSSGNAFSFVDKNNFSLLAGSNRNFSNYIIGQYSGFKKSASEFKGIKTDKLLVGAFAEIDLKKKDYADFVVSASMESHLTYDMLSPEKIYKDALSYTQKFLNNSLMITTPDKDFNEGYKWALIGTDRFFVNTPGLGKSLVAGYSTTAQGWDGGHKVNGRPGYGWYFGRDGCWSGFALLDYGDFEKVKSVLEFFNKYQDLSGKIFHELTTSGAIHYDSSDATPLYIILAGKYLHHTGDVEFIKKNWSYIKKAIDFCYSTDTDGDHLIENTNVGHGWVEGGGLYTAHTEIYLAACWAEALRQASYMAEQIGLSAERRTYRDEFEKVKKIINTDFWNEQENFLSFSKLKNEKYNSEKTVLSAVPVYFEMIDSAKAKKVADAYAENYFSSDWGVRILREDSPIFNPRGYHTGSVWPLFTGWAALAEFKNENYVQGYSHIMNNLLVYKNWQLGFVEEVLNGAEYKPGGVCSHQAWSETMVLQPTIEGMLGLEVDAANNKIKFSPRLPADWDFIKVERIKIGNDFINFEMKRINGKYFYNFTPTSSKQIRIEFYPLFPLGTEFQKVEINGKPTEIEKQNYKSINLSFALNRTSKIEIDYKNGISVLPVVSHPMPNDKSEGFRILSDKLEGDAYIIEVQGISGTTKTLEVYRNGKIEKVEVKFEKSDNKYINKTVKLKIER